MSSEMDFEYRDQYVQGEIGDVIVFKRGNLFIFGEIIILREASCIVEISKEYADELKLNTTRTVVRHGNYKIIETSKVRARVSEQQIDPFSTQVYH